MFQAATAALAIVEGGAEIGKAFAQNEAAEARTHALELESKQIKLQTQQKTLNNYAVMEKVLAAQEAAQTIRGTSFSSPSFNAIQRDTFNTGVKRQKNINLEGDIAEENIDIEKRNVRNTLFAQLFGDVAETAPLAYQMVNKMPTLGD
jgi:hypothetical protein